MNRLRLSHRFRFFAGAGMLLLAVSLAAEVEIPRLESHVMDLTATLSTDEKQQLETLLTDYEKKKGSQIAVLIVPSTKPEEIEQYSIRVVEKWKLGRKGVDDGILILVAKEDRRVRIEVGYGLEGILPDAKAMRIIDEQIVPNFKNGDFYEGIESGVKAVIGVISGETLPAPVEVKKSSSNSSKSRGALMSAVGIILGFILSAFMNRFVAASVAGGITFVASWILFSVIATAAIYGVIVFFFLIVQGFRGAGSGGGIWSSGSSSGGSSGGGFSGGGGSFGGGGASGSW